MIDLMIIATFTAALMGAVVWLNSDPDAKVQRASPRSDTSGDAPPVGFGADVGCGGDGGGCGGD